MTASATTPWPSTTTHLIVGDLVIDLASRRVRRPDGVRHELPQRVFDLLMVFLAEPRKVHTREALFERVWQGVIVEDANLTQGVWMLRKAFGEERRQWFRTVSKTGYCFEPPGEIVARDSDADDRTPPAETRPASSADGHDDATRPTILPPPATLGARLRRTLTSATLVVIAACALLLPVVPLSTLRGDRQVDETGFDVPAGPPPLRVRLVQGPVPDATRTDARIRALPSNPSELLEAWLAFKLESLPETQLLSPFTAPSQAPISDERVVIAWTERDPRKPDALLLHVRIAGATPGRDDIVLVVRGDVGRTTAMADEMSRRVMAALLPDRSADRWPGLPANAIATHHYTQAVRAAYRRDWATAERETAATLAAAPTFGPAYWLQTRLLARQGRIPLALQSMVEARRLSVPLPERAQQVIDTKALGFDPAKRSEAIAQYRQLVRAYPRRDDYRLTMARLLTRAGRPDEALQLAALPKTRVDALPYDQRILHALVLGEGALANGDPANARRSALIALALIERSGPGLDQERGAARMLLALAHHGDPGNPRRPELYEIAAQAYESAGDRPNAAYAWFMADELRIAPQPVVSPRLAPVIAIARENGNVAMEVQALRMTAYRFYRSGHHALFREHLRRAQESSNRSNDLSTQRILDLDLMGEDFFLGNFASAQARVRRLRAGKLDGTIGYLVPQLDSLLLYYQGHFDKALETLRDGERAIGPDGKRVVPSVVAPHYACAHADILLTQFKVDEARAEIKRCREGGASGFQVNSLVLEVRADIIEGDHDSARVKLRDVERLLGTMQPGIERWTLVPSIGSLVAALGDYPRAERLLADESPHIVDSGYQLVIADLETTQAEIAAARGDWTRSRALSSSARRRLPQDAWLPMLRLERRDIVDDLANGDRVAARARMQTLAAQAQRLGDTGVVDGLKRLDALLTRDTDRVRTPPLDPTAIWIDWLYERDLPSVHAPGRSR